VVFPDESLAASLPLLEVPDFRDRWLDAEVISWTDAEGHEAPSVVTGNTTVTTPGLTFTVEPGIYIPHFGGVRVEENVAVTQDGVDVLTAYPRELRSL